MKEGMGHGRLKSGDWRKEAATRRNICRKEMQ